MGKELLCAVKVETWKMEWILAKGRRIEVKSF